MAGQCDPRSISGPEILDSLGKPLTSPEVRRLLEMLGIPEGSIKLKGRAQTDFTARDCGVVVFFAPAQHAPGVTNGLPRDAPILSDVMFSVYGFKGGASFSGELPYELSFSDSRAKVRERLGEPHRVSLIENDRWERNGRYLTLDYLEDFSGIYKVTCGLLGGR